MTRTRRVGGGHTPIRGLARGLMLALFLGSAQAAFGAIQGAQTEPVRPAPVAADRDRGQALYERHCAQCHGASGRGDGPAAERVYPRPRDFTTAVFKVRSTLSGQLPTDQDLFRVISQGLPGTSMPAWKKYLSEEDRWQLAHYVKTFDGLGLFKNDPPKEQLVVGEPPKVTGELIARGQALYQAKKCWQCHGQLGRGDGPSAVGMKDEWRFPIRPVNFTKGWRFRGGEGIGDIYRTLTTGFDGTPMPSFLDAIPAVEDRWALAAYVKSLTRPRKPGQVLKARRVGGGIPADPYAREWEEAAYVDFPLAGQIILEPRWFTPAHDVITARALYDQHEVAILLEWDDGTHSRGEGGKPADQVAVQFPATRSVGEEKPYFVLGDPQHPVDYWRWNAAQGLSRLTVSGHQKMSPRETAGVVARGGYKDGQYRVILRRQLAAQTDDEPAFEEGRFVPIAFHLWDGEEGEEGLKMAISAWYYLLLEPPPALAVYLWPTSLGLVTLAGELWLMRRLRKGREPRA
ncbi:MAG TPA: c-type cytochrome [Methylomirabilota bacterium]|nr:c-type cytochrome [Methylomirabilota bacterium]